MAETREKDASSGVASCSGGETCVEEDNTAFGVEIFPTVFGPLFLPETQPQDDVEEIRSIMKNVKKMNKHFARRMTSSVLTDIYTATKRPFTTVWASRLVSEGRGKGRGLMPAPYTSYIERPAYVLADDTESRMNSDEYLYQTLKISRQHFDEIVEAVERMDDLRRKSGSLPPRRGKSKYTFAEQVFISLHHFQKVSYPQLGARFNIQVSTVSSYFLRTVLALASLKSAYIVWPTRDQRNDAHRALAATTNSDRLREFGVWGFLDGTLTKIGQPGWCDASHDVTYTNYLTVHHLKGSGFFLGSMVVVMPDGSIVFSSTGFHGSMHDRTIVKQLLHVFERGAVNPSTNERYFEDDENILGDKGFYTKFDEVTSLETLQQKRDAANDFQTSIIGMLKGNVRTTDFSPHVAADYEEEEGLLCPARLAVEQTFGQCGSLFPLLRNMKQTCHSVGMTGDIVGAIFVLFMMWFEDLKQTNETLLAHVEK